MDHFLSCIRSSTSEQILENAINNIEHSRCAILIDISKIKKSLDLKLTDYKDIDVKEVPETQS
jgi:hypothetical protein